MMLLAPMAPHPFPPLIVADPTPMPANVAVLIPRFCSTRWVLAIRRFLGARSLWFGHGHSSSWNRAGYRIFGSNEEEKFDVLESI